MRYRHKCLTRAMLGDLEDLFASSLGKWRCRLIEFGGEADHVHLLFEAHPALNLSRLVGNLKAVTARQIRKRYAAHLERFYWKPYFWNKAYALISVGGRASLETLINYVQDQEQPEDKPTA